LLDWKVGAQGIERLLRAARRLRDFAACSAAATNRPRCSARLCGCGRRRSRRSASRATTRSTHSSSGILTHQSSERRYRHGEHCAYCPRSHDCPALVAIARRDVAIFAAGRRREAMVRAGAAGRRWSTARRRSEGDRGVRQELRHWRCAVASSPTGPLDSGDGNDARARRGERQARDQAGEGVADRAAAARGHGRRRARRGADHQRCRPRRGGGEEGRQGQGRGGEACAPRRARSQAGALTQPNASRS
jgi:hypothetical protein